MPAWILGRSAFSAFRSAPFLWVSGMPPACLPAAFRLLRSPQVFLPACVSCGFSRSGLWFRFLLSFTADFHCVLRWVLRLSGFLSAPAVSAFLLSLLDSLDAWVLSGLFSAFLGSAGFLFFPAFRFWLMVCVLRSWSLGPLSFSLRSVFFSVSPACTVRSTAPGSGFSLGAFVRFTVSHSLDLLSFFPAFSFSFSALRSLVLLLGFLDSAVSFSASACLLPGLHLLCSTVFWLDFCRFSAATFSAWVTILSPFRSHCSGSFLNGFWVRFTAFSAFSRSFVSLDFACRFVSATAVHTRFFTCWVPFFCVLDFSAIGLVLLPYRFWVTSLFSCVPAWIKFSLFLPFWVCCATVSLGLGIMDFCQLPPLGLYPFVSPGSRVWMDFLSAWIPAVSAVAACHVTACLFCQSACLPPACLLPAAACAASVRGL